MRKSSRKQKYYLVLSKDKNYKHGAFPHSPEGLKMAEDYVKRLKGPEELYIVEK